MTTGQIKWKAQQFFTRHDNREHNIKPPPDFAQAPPPRFLYKVMLCLNK